MKSSTKIKIMLGNLFSNLFDGSNKKVRFLKQGNIIILAKKLGEKKGVKHRCLIVSDVYLPEDSDITLDNIKDPDWVKNEKNQRLLARSVRAVGVTFSSREGDYGIALRVPDFPDELKGCLGFEKEITYLRISEPIEIRAGEVDSELCPCNKYLWDILCQSINSAGYTNHQVLTALESQCNCISDDLNIETNPFEE